MSENEPKKEAGALHPDEWYWLEQDDGLTLLADCRHRPVVLTAMRQGQRSAVLAVRDADGRLVPLERSHDMAKALAAIPRMIRALRVVADQSKADTSNADVAEAARSALDWG